MPGLSLSSAVSQASAGFAVRDVPSGSALAELEAAGKGTAFLVTDGTRWVLLTDPSAELVDDTLPAERSAAWRALDVTIAHRVLIDRLWGLQDTEDVVGFEHDVPAAVAAARAHGRGGAAAQPDAGGGGRGGGGGGRTDAAQVDAVHAEAADGLAHPRVRGRARLVRLTGRRRRPAKAGFPRRAARSAPGR